MKSDYHKKIDELRSEGWEATPKRNQSWIIKVATQFLDSEAGRRLQPSATYREIEIALIKWSQYEVSMVPVAKYIHKDVFR
mgnify:CR=1 FL=1